jgi:hypothetical protein
MQCQFIKQRASLSHSDQNLVFQSPADLDSSQKQLRLCSADCRSPRSGRSVAKTPVSLRLAASFQTRVNVACRPPSQQAVVLRRYIPCVGPASRFYKRTKTHHRAADAGLYQHAFLPALLCRRLCLFRAPPLLLFLRCFGGHNMVKARCGHALRPGYLSPGLYAI